MIIFGDSYADPTYPEHYTWTKQIKPYFKKVKNYAIKGTGPDWSLDNFCKLDEKMSFEAKSNTNILFIISSIHRYNFSFLKPEHQSLCNHLLYTNNKEATKMIQKEKYFLYKNFLKDFTRYYVKNSSYERTEFFKIISFLYLHSKYYNKILIASVFEKQDWYDIQTIPSNNNFHVISTPLYDLQDTLEMGQDTLPNHMIEHNHNEFTKVLVDWFNHENPINLDNFQKNIK